MTSAKLRIAVTGADHDGLQGQVGAHFGRCAAFTLIDVEAGRVGRAEVIENPFVHGHAPGDVPEFISEQEADVLLTGGIGYRALAFFDHQGIQVSSGHCGTVAEAVDAWMAGATGGPEACAGHHDHDHDHDYDHGRGGCGRHE